MGNKVSVDEAAQILRGLKKNAAPVAQTVSVDEAAQVLRGLKSNTPEFKQEAPNALEKFGHGMDEAVGGVMQGMLYVDKKLTGNPAYDKYTADRKAAEALYQKGRSDNGQTGIDGWSALGGLAITLPAAGATKGFQGAKILSKAGAKVLGQNAAVGATIGAMQGADNADQRLSNIGLGAAGGAAGAVVGKGLEKIGQAAGRSIAQKATQKTLDAPKNALAQGARNTGYSVPPSYSNPNFFNKTLSKIAGEADLARIASAKNQQITNSLARKSVGIADDQPITPEALGTVRQQAGQAYEVLKTMGTVTTDRRFAKDMNDILKAYTSAGRDFNIAGGDRIRAITDQIKSNTFGTDAALDMVKIVRSEATKAFRAGDSELGLANQQFANAIETQLERALAQNTQVPRAAVQNFINARKVIAKTYSIENALDASGNVSARKLSSTLGKKPLTGELKQAAQFAQVYPQLNNVGVHGGNGITLFDSVAGIGTGAATSNIGALGVALARPAMRAGLNTGVAGKAFGTPSYSNSFLRLLQMIGKESPVLPVAGANASAKDRPK